MTGIALFLLLLTPADLDYWRGMALARAGHLEEAAAAFRHGRQFVPDDKRFPIELAGVAFKRKQYGAAAGYLRRALSLDPRDAYANGFLATVYFLQGNTEAALVRWNRTGKPRIERIRTEPEPRMDPVLLAGAFAFSPAGTLTAADYRATLERLRMLDAFSSWTLRLEPRESDDGFDAVLVTSETRPWVSALRGLPFQTVSPEWRNAGGRGVNIEALFRWDMQKRRASLAVSGPIAREAAWRYRAYLEGRNENWQLPSAPGFNLKRTEAGAEVASAGTGWRWMAGVAVSKRWFRNAPFESGTVLDVRTAVDRDVLRVPERRFTLSSHGELSAGRFFGRGLFSKPLARLSARWLPRANGDDYEMLASLRAGAIAGHAPFDDLYMVGLERDNDLWLRGHVGTADGKKGSAPMGRHFALLNWELNKIVHAGGLYTITAGPFFDSGRVFGPQQFGESGWLWDTGLQAKLRLPGGIGAAFVWGRQLRTGRNAFYALPLP